MAGRRISYGLALAGSLVFYAAYREWFSWVLLVILLVMPWLSLVLSLRAMLRLKLFPSASTRVEPDSRESIQLISRCTEPMPPLKSRILLTRPCTGEEWILQAGAELPTDHCGGLVARLDHPRVYDYLGLFSMKIRNTKAATILVMPRPVPMAVPGNLIRHIAHSWQPKPGGGYAENHEIRPFRPGDGLNQVHWKLSAKTDSLMLREPMEPEQGLMLLTMDVQGTPEELDRRFGRLLWIGQWLVKQQISFEVRGLTGNGVETHRISDENSLHACLDSLLCAPAASEGSIRNRSYAAAWQFYIGGDTDEA